MKHFRSIALSVTATIALLVLAGCDHCDEPERVCCPCEPATTGSIIGVVKFIGEPPPRKIIEIPPEAQVQPDKVLIVDDRLIVNPTNLGVLNAVIRLMDVDDKSPIPPSATSPLINMQGCFYSPHVLLVPPKSHVIFLNPDHRLHNIHGFPLDFTNPESNRAVAPHITAFDYLPKYIAEPEIIKITNDLYSWMNCYLVVHDPRYARITDNDGKFEFKNLRPGKYTMFVFHEKFGEKTAEVVVKAGQAAIQDIKIDPRRKK